MLAWTILGRAVMRAVWRRGMQGQGFSQTRLSFSTPLPLLCHDIIIITSILRDGMGSLGKLDLPKVLTPYSWVKVWFRLDCCLIQLKNDGSNGSEKMTTSLGGVVVGAFLLLQGLALFIWEKKNNQESRRSCRPWSPLLPTRVWALKLSIDIQNSI